MHKHITMVMNLMCLMLFTYLATKSSDDLVGTVWLICGFLSAVNIYWDYSKTLKAATTSPVPRDDSN